MLFNYFLLYPFGHIGLIPVTFLINFPFTQVIVIFLTTAALVAEGVEVGLGVKVEEGVGVGVAVTVGDGVGVDATSTTSWNNLT